MLRSKMLRILPLLLVFRDVSSFQNNEDLLERALVALEKVLAFVLEYDHDMNLDAILNINVGQAHLRKTISKVDDPLMLKRLHKLVQKAERIYQLGAHVNASDPIDVIFYKYIVPPENWERDIEIAYGELDSNQKVNTGSYNVEWKFGFVGYVYTSIEECAHRNTAMCYSDRCIVQVANFSNNTESHECPLSQECFDNMVKLPEEFSEIQSGYSITHMLWLLQVARARNCKINYKTFNETVRRECSYILWELRKNARFGYIPILSDLLLEQISFCGLEGFGEFLTEELLEHILEIQHPYGCFRVPATTIGELMAVEPRVLRRRKRFTKVLKYDCNDHTTSFGITSLSLFIRLMIEKQL